MFDPIVFDNLKVVVEGEIYELDLSGEVSVVNREDFVDLAHFTRTYRISFQQHGCCIATLKLSTDLDNIHAELNPTRNEKPGCTVFIQFTYTQNVPFDKQQCANIQQMLEDIWGETRMITQRLSQEVGKEEYENLITVTFNRFIYEDQVGDLVEMIDYMLQTLDALEQ
ncbi:hypothetical protein [Bacillus sp. CGMCC 1.16541]|uniref:hypothetical protein n=1 Tax=Bacillus sp. CGMCC 1.16541 TaxID=2185143 RepID=UPI000D72A714|nr:hypothetical protein [Bacillus sp. CGMCC 1.16541]